MALERQRKKRKRERGIVNKHRQWHHMRPSGSSRSAAAPLAPKDPDNAKNADAAKKSKRRNKGNGPAELTAEEEFNYIPRKIREAMALERQRKKRKRERGIVNKHRQVMKAERTLLREAKSGSLGAEPVGAEAGGKVRRPVRLQLLKPWQPLLDKIQSGNTVTVMGAQKPKLLVRKSSGRKTGDDSGDEGDVIVGFLDEIAPAPPKLTIAPKYNDETLFPDKAVWKDAVKATHSSHAPMDKSQDSFERLRLDAVARYRQYRERISNGQLGRPTTGGSILGKRRKL